MVLEHYHSTRFLFLTSVTRWQMVPTGSISQVVDLFILHTIPAETITGLRLLQAVVLSRTIPLRPQDRLGILPWFTTLESTTKMGSSNSI